MRSQLVAAQPVPTSRRAPPIPVTGGPLPLWRASADHDGSRVVFAIPFTQLQAQTVAMRRQMVSVLSLPFLLSACMSGGPQPEFTLPIPPTQVSDPLPPSAPPPTAPPPSAPPPTTWFQTSQAACNDEGEGLAVELRTTVAAEVPYLAEWEVCQSTSADGSASTWLRNNTNAVWVLPGVLPGELSDFKRSADYLDAARAPAFDHMTAGKDVADEWRSFLRPGESPSRAVPDEWTSFLKPGESVRIARPPEQVQWDLDLSLTLAWSSQGALIDKFAEVAPGIATEVLTPKTSAYRAILTCTFSIFDHARRYEQLDTTDGAEVFKEGLESAKGAVNCASESDEARITLEDGRTATVKSAVIKAMPEDSHAMSSVTSRFAPIQQLARKGVLRLATRGKSG